MNINEKPATNTPSYAELAAIEAGLPLQYADRLRGETYGELLKDAQDLMQDYKAAHFTPPMGNPDPRPSNTTDPLSQTQRQFAEALEEAKQGIPNREGWIPLRLD